ncbi:competence protein [Flavobacterium granuli]|uniref:Sterol desaturase/sphingolipid hydroxylase (Fatty acid hydroxylase superfamily) n=1 Tax=Flavobacterium granuli TaxID=280093 RepID=A0ABU1S1X5_9FLAO|nr:competence protein [Flavobacterium granuli]MDR6845041.1 sterol desaturase/sphingolipid hydroxylase (fatty acid hydroxylase superfamily) [Flavobacterium granuli]
MAFDKLKDNTDNIQEQAQIYFEKSASYYKLWGFKVAMKSTTMILKFTLILLCFSMVLLFGSIAAALAIGVYFDNYAIGFSFVGGFYLLATFLLFLVKEKVIEGPILEKFSEIFFND